MPEMRRGKNLRLIIQLCVLTSVYYWVLVFLYRYVTGFDVSHISDILQKLTRSLNKYDSKYTLEHEQLAVYKRLTYQSAVKVVMDSAAAIYTSLQRILSAKYQPHEQLHTAAMQRLSTWFTATQQVTNTTMLQYNTWCCHSTFQLTKGFIHFWLLSPFWIMFQLQFNYNYNL